MPEAGIIERKKLDEATQLLERSEENPLRANLP
jgi:hypothetical protein